MARDPKAPLGEPQAEVIRITVVPGSRPGSRLRSRTRASGIRIRPRAIAFVGLGLVALSAAGVLAGTTLIAGDRHVPTPSPPAEARLPGARGVAAAYGYPLSCLSVSIALHDPRFARADFDHAVPCGEYTGYPTAIFRRAHGRWVPVLEATSYTCPVRSLPFRVQWDLAVCAAGLRQHAGP